MPDSDETFKPDWTTLPPPSTPAGGENPAEKNSRPNGQKNIPTEEVPSVEGTRRRLDFLQSTLQKYPAFLAGTARFSEPSTLEGNIENYIGMAQVPTGIIGPLRVIGNDAQGDFYVPLATTEGALVASYQRGAKACSLAGGVTSVCLAEGVQRSPLFKFNDLRYLMEFLAWALGQVGTFEEITRQQSRYARLESVKTNIEGNHLILTFEYHTGDAAGQNMVTLCTDAICQYILAEAPVKPEFWFIEGNYSGDKKATALSFSNVRGKKVTAEIELPQVLVSDLLKTTPEAIAQYWRSSTLGTIQSGAIGAQGHYANGLAALFIATGQDVTCVSEAAVGITRMEVTHDGNLYASVTLPNLIVGTVGGGTSLPTQRECLELLDCYGAGKAKKLAEICGATVLAGELSIAAALSAGHFTSAHQKYGRKK
ncbi:hydroxymethylglutaryl-CoA reductase [Rhabdobacter roseus]|uniref:hydroxymethylglutaryl-CoA reductase (NADPH) n=1 Tax=Rhabdobacter roseus TaxID=1655419 RepID=A0A840TM49_9BACT|nr:hydroxymethylglutaryl-CoA reductase [Rhabdobacter roseus]MBB5282313.1 hydroxymethylglutaryl-CoA reductase (NADPH) [Rhabdobacter roseus]